MIKAVFCGLVILSITLNSTAFEARQIAPPSTNAVEPTEISLEELVKMEIPIVEGASKYKQKITEAPASVTVITADEVKKYGYRTLADILRSVPGLYVSYDRANARLGVRAVLPRGY